MDHKNSIEWVRKRTEEYRSTRNGIGEVVEDLDEVGKLGSGFGSMDELEEVDIGRSGVTSPTYVNANLTPEQKAEVCDMLREFADYFA
jgi:hypothetical protein